MSKEENHAKAPQSAAFVHAMREAFGADQVKVVWVREGQVIIGEKPKENA